MQYRTLAATNFIFYMQFKQFLRQSLIWRGLYFVTVFALNLVLSRLLQAEVSGWLYFIINIFSFIIVLGGFNIDSGITYFSASSVMPKKALAIFALFWAFVSTCVLIPFLYLFFKFFFVAPQIITSSLVFFGVNFIFGALLVLFYVPMFYVDNNVSLPNIVLFTTNTLYIFFILFFAAKNPPLNVVFSSYCYLVCSQGIIIMLLYFFKNGNYLGVSLLSIQQIKQLLQYASIAFGGNIVLFLVYRIDYWFVERYCSPASLGNYIQASKLGQLLLVIPQVLAAAVFPQTASMVNTYQISRDILIIFRLMIQFFAFAFLLLLLIGKWLLPFVFGSTFNDIYAPVLLLMPGILCLSMLVILLSFFSGKQRSKYNFNGAMLALAVILLGDFFLIPIYGIYAAAMVSTIAYFANFVYAIYQFKKITNCIVSDLYDFRKSDWFWLLSLIKKQ